MKERPPLDPTVDIAPSGDELDAGLAAAFGPDSGPPLPAGGSVLQALSAGLPSVPRILLREPDSFGGSPIVRPSSEEMPDKQDAGARLQLHGEIARGGMGAVLKGRDADLGRDVAVKVLLETHQGKTEMLQRFVEEAQINGQLQHPGITPVYELGQFADKRPYFTMKLVKGKTLATLLAARKSPQEEQPRNIGVFAQICHTLAYAHAHGVIHRDLKPSNVMVGAFGEVQVMDWGLAKVLQAGGIAEEQKAQERAEISVISTQRSEGSSTAEAGSQTLAGTVLGTPAFMAPEQACGAVELVDERADVFGLGAILCAILTGKPPYVGRQEEIAHRAQSAKLGDAFARLDACGADAELIRLTKRCLAAELWERPRHAGEVADQVTAYQQSVAERLRQAELAKTEARARAEEESKTRLEAEARLSAERQARRMTLGLAAAVLLSLTLVGGGGLWYQQHLSEQREEASRREAELREAVRASLDKVADLRQRARWGEARAVLEQVRQRLGPSGMDDLRHQVEQAEADLTLVDRLEVVRMKELASVVSYSDYAFTLREYAAVFREAGIGEETEAAEIVAARIQASAVREQLVAALDDWAQRVYKEPARRAWLLAVARATDPDPWRDRFRDPVVWEDRAALERLAREAKVSELSPQIIFALAGALDNRGADAVPLLTAAQRRYPSDFWLNFLLGQLLQNAKREEEAIGYYRAAMALRPATPLVFHYLGTALAHKGRVDEAIAEYHRALELDPEDASAHNNLGLALRDKGRLDEAIAEYYKAIELNPKLAAPHSNLGIALVRKGRLDEAIVQFRKGVELEPKAAGAHGNLGNALWQEGRLDEAIVQLQKAVEIDPKSANARANLGVALRVKGQLDEAVAEHRRAVTLEPKSARYHYTLGLALGVKGQLEEAAAEYRRAIALDPKHALAHTDLGSVLRQKGRVDEAIAEYKKAIKLDPKYAPAHNNLGNALRQRCRVDEAIAEYHKAIGLDPKFALVHDNLGVALRDKGRLDEAIVEFKKAIALDPKYAAPHNNLGVALRDKGRLDEAIAEYHKAIELDPKSALAHRNLGDALRNKGRVEKAIAEHRKAIALDPKFAPAHNGLGIALRDKGRLDEAIAEFHKAIELDPKDANAHYNLGSALRVKGRLDEAIAQWKKALELDPKLAPAHGNLGLALFNKDRLEEAIAQWKKALELDPKDATARSLLAHWEPAAALLSKLPAFLQGKYQPRDNTQRLHLAHLCGYKKYHRAAAQLYTDTFAAEPKRTDDLVAQDRYNAACYAALAAAGQGEDAAKLDAKERASLRKQALDWLRADLVLHTKQLASRQAADRASVWQQMRHWQLDSDLAAIRDKAALAQRPADELQACEKLWADVAALLKKAGEETK